MPNPALCNDPIFILGIFRRSGTNFLYNLVRLHPDCNASPSVWEDHLLQYADLLVRYADIVYRRWRPTEEPDEGLKTLFCRYLGDGMISFLESQIDGGRLVTKTPSVRNLRYFHELFPNAYLIILVRDGRAVVESQITSFGGDYEAAMREWARAAHNILDFDRVIQNPELKYLIVRYEDLCRNLDEELGRVFAFLGLDVETYDFDAAANLPVRGSSVFRGGEEAVHWNPVEKTPDFNSLLRWSRWNRALHERFNWIAGQYLVQFGYEEKRYTNNRALWAMWNKALDIRWQVRELSRTLWGALRRRIFQKAS